MSRLAWHLMQTPRTCGTLGSHGNPDPSSHARPWQGAALSRSQRPHLQNGDKIPHQCFCRNNAVDVHKGFKILPGVQAGV